MKESTDVWFIAYLMHKNYKIDDYVVLPNRRVKCKFNLTDEQWQKNKLEFNNSELVKFKTLIEQIKDLCY